MSYIKLVFILLSIFVVSSCNQHPDRSCDTNSDCEGELICFEKICKSNPCKSMSEDICGKGECIPGGLDDGIKYTYDYGKIYHCECHEESVLIENNGGNFSFCSPTCNTYTEECVEFSKMQYLEDYNRCNISKGHCDTKCQGEGSCQDGYVCDGGVCERYID